jgi:anti-sigma B factor antagonist
MQPVVHHHGKVSVVDLSGRITIGRQEIASLHQLTRTMQELVESNKLQVVLDMEKVAYMDSPSIGEIVSWQKRLLEKGGSIKIAKPSQTVMNLFQITKLNRVFDIFGDQNDAIASF